MEAVHKEAADAVPSAYSLGWQRSRTNVFAHFALLNAGYAVQEAHTLDKAKDLVHSDSIDITLLCHTVPEGEKRILIALVREKRSLMPVIYIRSYRHESVPRTCIGVDNEPEALLQSLKSVIQSPGASKAT